MYSPSGYTKEQVYSSVGQGWKSLLDELLDCIRPEQITCVKEKFGMLRVYINNEDATDENYELLDELEDRSATICEDCGKPGKPHGKNWVRTTCKEHSRE